MALHRVTDNNLGVSVDVEAPEDISEEELYKLAAEQHAQNEEVALYERLQPQPGIVDKYVQEPLKGFASGALGMVESAGIGAATMLDEEYEAPVREGIQSVFAPAQNYLKADRGLEDTVPRKFTEALGSFAAMAAPTALSGGLAGFAAAGALGIGAGAGEASERARAYGASEEERSKASALGAAIGVTEFLPLGFIKFFGQATSQSLLDVGRRTLNQAGVEGLQEWAANTAQNIVEQGYNPEKDTFEGGKEAAGYGAGVGGVVQLLLEGITKRTISKRDAAEDKRTDVGNEDGQRDFLPEELDAANAELELEEATAPNIPLESPEQIELLDSPTEIEVPNEAQGELDFNPTPVVQESPAPIQPDMIDIAETQQLEEITAQQEQEINSDIETKDRAIAQDRIDKEAQGREAILNDLIESNTGNNFKNLRNDFVKALEAAGVTKTQPTVIEDRTIKNARNTNTFDLRKRDKTRNKKEAREQRENLEETDLSADSDLTALEGAIPEKLDQRQEPAQRRLKLGIDEGKKPTPRAPVTVPVDQKFLDELGVRKAAPIRTRLEGRDVPEAELQEELTAYASNKAAVSPASLASGKLITEYLENVPAEQGRLFNGVGNPRQSEPTGATGADGTTAGSVPVSGAPDAQDTPATPTTAGPLDSGPSGNAGNTPAPNQGGVGSAVPVPADPNGAALGESNPLNNKAAMESALGAKTGNPDVEQSAVEGVEVFKNPGEKRKAERTAARGKAAQKSRDAREKKKTNNKRRDKSREKTEEKVDAEELSTSKPIRKKQFAKRKAETKAVEAKEKAKEAAIAYRQKKQDEADQEKIDKRDKTRNESPHLVFGPEGKPNKKFDYSSATFEPEKQKDSTSGKAQPKQDGKKKEQDTVEGVRKALARQTNTEIDAEIEAHWTEKVSAVVATWLSKMSSVKMLKSNPTDPTTKDDKVKILQLLQSKAVDKDTKALQTIFSKFPRLIDNLDNLNYFLVYEAGQFTGTKGKYQNYKFPTAEKEFYSGMSPKLAAKAAVWMRANMSDRTLKWYDKRTRERMLVEGAENSDTISERIATARTVYTTTDSKGKKITEEELSKIAEADIDRELQLVSAEEAAYVMDEARQEAIDKKEDADSLARQETEAEAGVEKAYKQQTLIDMGKSSEYELGVNEVNALDNALHPLVSQMLNGGNLVDALRTIAATTNNDILSRMAGALSEGLGSTKVEVVYLLTNKDGKHVAGLFDPKTNTIKLDSELGVNTHTIMHETTHALVSDSLDSGTSPEAKELKEIYNAVKDVLGTAYGAESLQEFVAEAFSNVRFQQQLASMHLPKGTKYENALKKLKRAVMNLLRRAIGMSPLPVHNNVFDRVDTLTNALLAPAPDSRNAGELYADGMQAAAYKEKVTSALQGTKTTLKDLLINAKARLGSDGRAALYSAIGLLHLSNMAAHAKFLNPKRIYDAVNVAHGDKQKRHQKLLLSDTLFSQFRKSHTPEQAEALFSVMSESTLDEVDPTKPSTDYKGEKLKIHKRLSKKLKEAGPDATKVYAHMRDVYSNLYKELKEVVLKRIDDVMGDDKEGAAKVKSQVLEKMFRNNIDPYFALHRVGDYKLTFNFEGEFVTEHFESPAKRDQLIKIVRQMGKESLSAADIRKEMNTNKKTENEAIDTLMNLDTGKLNKPVDYKNAPSASFVNSVFTLLDKAAPDSLTKEGVKAVNSSRAAMKNDIMGLFVEMLPESSFAKALQKREGALGFRSDMFEVFRDRAFSMGYQIETLKNSAILHKLADEKREEMKKSPESDNNGELYQKLIDAATFAASPPKEKWITLGNRLAFLGTIGFNPSSAIVNLTQIPLVVGPMLAGEYGVKETAYKLAVTQKLLFNSGFGKVADLSAAYGDDTQLVTRVAPGIDNYYKTNAKGELEINKEISKLSALTKGTDFKELGTGIEEILTDYSIHFLVSAADKQSLLASSQAFDVLDLGDSKGRGALESTSLWSAFMFHHGERWTRQTTMVTAYMLEVDKRKADAKKNNTELTDADYRDAAMQSLYKTEEYNGGSHLGTVPSLGKQGMMRLAMMYKPYGLAMYANLFKTGFRAIAQNPDPKVRVQARKQMVGVIGSTLLLAGVQGVPMFHIVAAVYNLMLTDDDDEDFETATRHYLGEFAYKGPVNAATGMDIAARVGLSGLLYKSNPYAEGQSVPERIMMAATGPFGSVASQMIKGVAEIGEATKGGAINERELLRGIESTLPTALRNPMRAVRYMVDGAPLTRRGDVIVEGLDGNDMFWQGMGFSPAAYTFQQEKNRSTKKIDTAVNKKRTDLLRKLYMTYRFQDYQGTRDVMDDIQVFNKKHLRTVGDVVIPTKTILRSMRQHHKTSSLMQGGVISSPLMKFAREQAELEWGAFDGS